MKIIGLFGEPAVGKSTLMKKIIQQLGVDTSNHETFAKLVVGHKKENVYIVGRYDGANMFPGTDRLSMAAQPEVAKWLATLGDDSVVIFEGDRLSTSTFMENCVELAGDDASFLFIQASDDIKKFRHEDRNDDQSDQFLKSRVTKYQNIMSNMCLMDNIHEFQNNNLEDQARILEFVKELVG